MSQFKIKYLKDLYSELEKRRDHIKMIMEGNFLVEIIQGRREAQEIMKKHGTDYETIQRLIKPLAEREKELFALADEQSKNTLTYIEERGKIENEMTNISNELYFLEGRHRL